MTGTEVDLETEGDLPESFPTELPLPEGVLQHGMGTEVNGGNVWGLSFIAEDPAASLHALRDEFLSAGFEEAMWNETEHTIMGAFGNSEFVVTVGSMDLSDSSAPIDYSVSTRSAE